MKFILLTILLPCVLGQPAGQCPPLPEDPECEAPHLICHMPAGPDGCPIAPHCVQVNPYEPCSARPVCPTACAEGEMYCDGGVDADGCPQAQVCHAPGTDNCPSSANCPVFCGPNQMFCPGEADPNDPNGCNMHDSCIDVDPTKVCQAFCPPTPCPQPEFPCHEPLDSLGCEAPPMCSTNGRFLFALLLFNDGV